MPARSSRSSPDAKIGFIGYGTSHWAITESRDQLREETDVKTSYFRLRAYPFTEELAAFIDAHDRIYVVEQNRDAQLLQLMQLELTPERHREAAQRAALQRPADRRPQRHRRYPGAGRVRSREEDGTGAIGARHDRRRVERNRHGDTNQGQSHRPRAADLQGRQDDAVRRLRAQRHLRAHHRRVLRDGRRSQPGRSSCRASAARARARRTSWAARTASTPSTAACRRSAPARCSPTRS